jgi:hypothetical protein
MFLLYYSEGCNICGGLFRKCYINDLHTTTCSDMLGHRSLDSVRISASNVGSNSLLLYMLYGLFCYVASAYVVYFINIGHMLKHFWACCNLFHVENVLLWER